jgi:hypothetical protein
MLSAAKSILPRSSSLALLTAVLSSAEPKPQPSPVGAWDSQVSLPNRAISFVGQSGPDAALAQAREKTEVIFANTHSPDKERITQTIVGHVALFEALLKTNVQSRASDVAFLVHASQPEDQLEFAGTKKSPGVAIHNVDSGASSHDPAPSVIAEVNGDIFMSVRVRGSSEPTKRMYVIEIPEPLFRETADPAERLARTAASFDVVVAGLLLINTMIEPNTAGATTLSHESTGSSPSPGLVAQSSIWFKQAGLAVAAKNELDKLFFESPAHRVLFGSVASRFGDPVATASLGMHNPFMDNGGVELYLAEVVRLRLSRQQQEVKQSIRAAAFKIFEPRQPLLFKFPAQP